MSSIDGRVALLTGANGGIGVATTERLLSSGATVVAVTRRASLDGGLAELADRCAGRLLHHRADMNDVDSLSGLVNETVEQLGRIDMLIPNAGLATVATVDQIDRQVWEETFRVNTTAPYLLARAAIPHMRAQSYGRILFTSSAAAYRGGFVGPHYAASKAALHGMVHYLSNKFAPDGLTVNAIAPAMVAGTTMIDEHFADGSAPRPPVGRLGTTGEVAELAVAMLSNGYLTGQVYLLDGGLYPN